MPQRRPKKKHGSASVLPGFFFGRLCGTSDPYRIKKVRFRNTTIFFLQPASKNVLWYLKISPKIKVSILNKFMSFDTIHIYDRRTEEKFPQSKNCPCPLLRKRSGSNRRRDRTPLFIARVGYTAIIGVHFKRQEMKKSGQLPIF